MFLTGYSIPKRLHTVQNKYHFSASAPFPHVESASSISANSGIQSTPANLAECAIKKLKELPVALGPLLTKAQAWFERARILLQWWFASLRRFLAEERTRKVLRNAGLAALGAVLALGLAFFALRNVILRNVIQSKIAAYEKGDAGMTISVQAAHFRGLAGVELEGLHLRSGSSAVDLGTLSVTASLRDLFLGRLRLRNLALSDLRIKLGGENTHDAAAPATALTTPAAAAGKNDP